MAWFPAAMLLCPGEWLHDADQSTMPNSAGDDAVAKTAQTATGARGAIDRTEASAEGKGGLQKVSELVLCGATMRAKSDFVRGGTRSAATTDAPADSPKSQPAFARLRSPLAPRAAELVC